MRYLRTNTAVIVSVGPFYDKTDGVTIETGLTITNERITLVADTDDGSAPTNILDNVTGATSGTDNDLNYITGNDAGMMQLELSAANTNRLGRLLLSITDAANHVPVFHEFMVVPALVYDTFFAATGGATFPAGTLASTTNITAGTIATVSGNVNGSVGSVTGNVGGNVNGNIAGDILGDVLNVGSGAIVTTSFAAGAIDAAAIANGAIDAATFAANAITSTVIADGAITAAKIATGAIDADALAADAVDEILDEALADSVPADGSLPTVRQALYMITQFLYERSVSGTTVTVKKVDGSTSLLTLTLNDATTPTSITRAT